MSHLGSKEQMLLFFLTLSSLGLQSLLVQSALCTFASDICSGKNQETVTNSNVVECHPL
jgi:hypothetical protein